jgi:hypothetical protein
MAPITTFASPEVVAAIAVRCFILRDRSAWHVTGAGLSMRR